MQTNILHYSHLNTRCILFFNGWGMDGNAIKHIQPQDFDIIECNNYTVIDDFSIDFSKYNEIFVIAWSMGVWAAQEIISQNSISFIKSIAINGTGLPMDNTMGIPYDMFKGTLDSWSEIVRTKFNMRMCGGRTEFQNLQQAMPQRTVENQKHELQSIFSKISDTAPLSQLKWDCAIIGEQDFIFTAENQKKYWTDKTKWFTLPIPHYPFAGFTKWEEIIEFGNDSSRKI